MGTADGEGWLAPGVSIEEAEEKQGRVTPPGGDKGEELCKYPQGNKWDGCPLPPTTREQCGVEETMELYLLGNHR